MPEPGAGTRWGIVVGVACALSVAALIATKHVAIARRVGPTVRALTTGHAGRTTPVAELPRTLGTNFTGLSDWDRDVPFVNLFKTSRAWISGSDAAWEDERTIRLDAHGYPASLAEGQVARTLMLTDMPATGGKYVVLYAGDGDIRFGGSARLLEGESRPNRLVVEMREGDTDGIILQITRTNRADPVRDIRVLPPGGVCEGNPIAYCDAYHPCGATSTCMPFETAYVDHLFHPTFLDRTRRFRVLRFMTWSMTNDTTERRWSDRAHVDDATYTVKGAPLEISFALAKALDADPWLNVPHLVDDDYVRRMAALAKEKLEPGHRLWIEHSNEVWNGAFPQGRYAREHGRALADGDEAMGFVRFHARRSKQIFSSFERAFGGHDRLVRILGAQAENPWATEALLSEGDTAQHVDALAIAPYFGWNVDEAMRDRVARMSVDQVFAALDSEILPAVQRSIEEQHALAQRFGVRLVAYEGGQGFVGIDGVDHDDQINGLLDAVNRDPRMRDVYTRYLDGWFRAGGETFLHFVNCGVFSRSGRWGALEHIRQPREQAPKYDALMRWFER